MISGKKRILCLVCCLAFLMAAFSGCSEEDGEEEENQTVDSEENVENNEISGTAVGDGRFTLRYTDEESLNPLECTNLYNCAVAALLFEGLFTVDEAFEAVPVLCEEYTSTDGITFEITVKSGVKFHDGSSLTAADVVYSINQARQSSKYASRLSGIESVSEGEGGGQTVVVKLYKANYKLPELLDVPVMKSGSAGDAVPIGTGPYQYSETEEGAVLVSFDSYRAVGEETADTLYLQNLSLSKLETAFSNYEADVLLYDPLENENFNLRTDYEARYYNTTILQYVGFNMQSIGVSEPEIRRAVSHAVNREYIAESIMNSHALPASVFISPAAENYNTRWAEKSTYSLQELSSIFLSLNMQDGNGDGYLDYNANGELVPFSIDFIVNEENEYKVEAAKEIELQLKSSGLNITLRTLPWEEYVKALQEGNFDMYYAEVQLTADFDLSAILTPGGSLNFGHVEDENYASYIDAYLGAAGENTETEAIARLCSYMYENAHIIPVVYRQNAVVTHRGEISNFKPTQSNLFYNTTALEITPK